VAQQFVNLIASAGPISTLKLLRTIEI